MTLIQFMDAHIFVTFVLAYMAIRATIVITIAVAYLFKRSFE